MSTPFAVTLKSLPEARSNLPETPIEPKTIIVHAKCANTARHLPQVHTGPYRYIFAVKRVLPHPLLPNEVIPLEAVKHIRTLHCSESTYMCIVQPITSWTLINDKDLKPVIGDTKYLVEVPIENCTVRGRNMSWVEGATGTVHGIHQPITQRSIIKRFVNNLLNLTQP